MITPHSTSETSSGPDAQEILQINSNKIADVLAQFSTTALADVYHARITSTPGDDLAEEDFADRVRSLLEPMTGLISLTICIPSMARLHPSNSLPKVANILREAADLHPKCRLSLVVHEAEQTWGASALFQRIVELRLAIYSIEFSRAFFPVEALICTAQACGLVSLTLQAAQVFQSPNTSEASDTSQVPTLTSLTVRDYSEALPGLDSLVHATAGTLTHLDLSSGSSISSVNLSNSGFPHLASLHIHEDLLPEAMKANMPALQKVILPTLMRDENCNTIRESLKSGWSQMRGLRVSRVVAGDVSKALADMTEKYPSITFTIGAIAVRQSAQLTPAALAISENLVNAGPPIAEDWPLGFHERQYPRLKSILLKVAEGHNHDDFVASLDVPNLTAPPTLTFVGKKKGKGGKR